ncbi:MAG: leucine-rich repeat protein, partial [Clostridia bacterium]|nr:leucine-rich repeat protein [Clostridia bacterium]
VTEIAAGAFKSKSVKAVYAGKNIKKIGKKAFAGCSEDVSVIIPENAERAEGALVGCKNVYFDSREGLTLVSYSGHEENITLASSCFSRKVVKLGNRLFHMFAYLKSIRLPEFLVYVGDECFSGCEDLEKIDFPRTLSEIGRGAFSKSGLKELALPLQLKKVSEYAFLGCKDLARASFSNPHTEIGAGAFAKCGLTQITLPERLTEIQSEVFRENKHLTSLVLPETVEAVWEYAFADSGLESLHLPDAVQVIGEGSFSGMPGLAKVRLSENIREIGKGAFAFSEKLSIIDMQNDAFSVSGGLLIDTENMRLISVLPALQKETVIIPDGITEIGDFAFAGIQTIRRIRLPESVKTIGAWAFRDMGEIELIEFGGGLPVFGENPFFGTEIGEIIGNDEIRIAVNEISADLYIYK